MKTHQVKIIFGLALLAACSIAHANSVVWTFNLPSTAKASQTPPYPTVATLTLTDILGGVQFLLDPNELSPGAKSPASDSFVKQVDFVYKGAALTASSFVFNTGAPVDTFTYVTNQNNLDSGYKTQDQHILVDFFDNAPNHAHPTDLRFNFTQTSTWTILGTSLGDFTDTYATSGPKPSPISGVISVDPYTLTEIHPTPSNWVAGATVPTVPLPAAAWLFGSALLGFVSLSNRRRV